VSTLSTTHFRVTTTYACAARDNGCSVVVGSVLGLRETVVRGCKFAIRECACQVGNVYNVIYTPRL
jgi:hypothetical protein